jgi:hypothetical protein
VARNAAAIRQRHTVGRRHLPVAGGRTATWIGFGLTHGRERPCVLRLGSQHDYNGGAFANYLVTNTLVRMFSIGQPSGTVLAAYTIQPLAANRVATVVLTTAASAGTATGFQVNTCAG